MVGCLVEGGLAMGVLTACLSEMVSMVTGSVAAGSSVVDWLMVALSPGRGPAVDALLLNEFSRAASCLMGRRAASMAGFEDGSDDVFSGEEVASASGRTQMLVSCESCTRCVCLPSCVTLVVMLDSLIRNCGKAKRRLAGRSKMSSLPEPRPGPGEELRCSSSGGIALFGSEILAPLFESTMR